MTRALTLACGTYDRTAALADGRVRVDGVNLTYLALPVEEIFYRMATYAEFDVSEMSLASYTLSLERGRPFVAIPVFPSRAFRHHGVYINTSSGISRPEDLAGRLVGVPEYQMTAAVWIRGILAEYHGVPVESVHYRTGGLHAPGRSEKLSIAVPGVDIQPIPEDQTLEQMLISGDLDAIYSARVPQPFVDAHPAIRRLWPDPRAAEAAYYERTGIFPIMHTVVIRREVYEGDRWLARSLLNAFLQAKQLVSDQVEETVAFGSMLPWSYADARATKQVMGADFWPYELGRNEKCLRTLLGYLHDQSLTERLWQPSELFAPETQSTFVI